MLVPIRQRFLIDRANTGISEIMEMAGQSPGDEASGTGNDDQVILVQIPVDFYL
jgi:hypothetical protein